MWCETLNDIVIAPRKQGGWHFRAQRVLNQKKERYFPGFSGFAAFSAFTGFAGFSGLSGSPGRVGKPGKSMGSLFEGYAGGVAGFSAGFSSGTVVLVSVASQAARSRALYPGTSAAR